MVTIKISRIAWRGMALALPQYETAGSAGMDLRADESFVLVSGERRLVPTGVALEIPEGFEGQIRPRSGLAVRDGVTVLNAPGTIDSDFRGEVCVSLINHGSESVRYERGARIAQLVIAPVAKAELIIVTELSPSSRGAGGFGSTGA